MRDLLYQPLARDSLSWSSDPGKRKSREGGVVVQEQGRTEGVRTRQKHISRLNSSHLFEQQGLTVTPQAWKNDCVMFISGCWWWLGLISESLLWSNPCKAPWWWWGQDEGLHKRHTCTHLYTLLQGCASWLDYIYHLHSHFILIWFRNPTINPYQKIKFTALAIMVDCQTHTPKDLWSIYVLYQNNLLISKSEDI